MTQLVNLMPWRQRQRQASRRRYCCVILSGGLVIALATGGLYAFARVDRLAAALRLRSDEGALAALSGRQPHYQALHEAWLRQQAQAQRLAATLAWHPRLSTLAQAMPESAWLTEIQYRQGQLAISGLARSFSALHDMEQALKATRGFRLSHTGETARDTQGRWRFQYQLVEDSEHVALP